MLARTARSPGVNAALLAASRRGAGVAVAVGSAVLVGDGDGLAVGDGLGVLVDVGVAGLGVLVDVGVGDAGCWSASEAARTGGGSNRRVAGGARLMPSSARSRTKATSRSEMKT